MSDEGLWLKRQSMFRTLDLQNYIFFIYKIKLALQSAVAEPLQLGSTWRASLWSWGWRSIRRWVLSVWSCRQDTGRRYVPPACPQGWLWWRWRAWWGSVPSDGHPPSYQPDGRGREDNDMVFEKKVSQNVHFSSLFFLWTNNRNIVKIKYYHITKAILFPEGCIWSKWIKSFLNNTANVIKLIWLSWQKDSLGAQYLGYPWTVCESHFRSEVILSSAAFQSRLSKHAQTGNRAVHLTN